MTFAELNLAPPILRALTDEGYEIPTPIQEKAIPPIMAGKDLLGSAQTGTGKTAAFALPILHRLVELQSNNSQPGNGAGAGTRRSVQALILSPTRELAHQISDSFRAYGRHLPFRNVCVYGGVGQGPQVAGFRNGVDICIATPGRLLDLMEQGHVDLRNVKVLVLDEADHMLDMGFIRDIRRIIEKLPKERQNLLFSATMPRDIKDLAHSLLKHPEQVSIAPVGTTAERVEQKIYNVVKSNKAQLLIHLINSTGIGRALVFTRTKHGADRLVKHLHKATIRSEAIHGNKSQNNRKRVLDGFKAGKLSILVATDVAARGIDVDGITHVFNYDLPNEPEAYVHRIGRTARAGNSGMAISFCDPEERSFLRDIERLTRQSIPVMTDHPVYVKNTDSDRDDRDDRREGRGDGMGRRGYSRDGFRDSHRDGGSRDGGRQGGYRSERSGGDRAVGDRPSGPRTAAAAHRNPTGGGARGGNPNFGARPTHSPRPTGGHASRPHTGDNAGAGQAPRGDAKRSYGSDSRAPQTNSSPQRHVAHAAKPVGATHRPNAGPKKPARAQHPIHRKMSKGAK